MSYNEIIHHLWLGFSSSFVGTLPLSMLNLTILQLALSNQFRQAVQFSLGASVVECIQIFVTLLGMNVLLKIPYLGMGFAIVSVPILIFLGVKNLQKKADTEGRALTRQHAFIQGVVLSFANVVVYPFWLLWGNVFVQNGWLKPELSGYFYFSIAAAVGTCAGFFVFILLGRVLWERLSRLQNIIDKLITFAFFGFAVFQCYNILILSKK
jgi:threonine/homoserine/homoserine lactone efflux protein